MELVLWPSPCALILSALKAALQKKKKSDSPQLEQTV